MPDVAAIRAYVEQQLASLRAGEEKVQAELGRWSGTFPASVRERHEVEKRLARLNGKITGLDDLLYFMDTGDEG